MKRLIIFKKVGEGRGINTEGSLVPSRQRPVWSRSFFEYFYFEDQQNRPKCGKFVGIEQGLNT